MRLTPLPVVLLSVALVFGGCFLVPSPYSDQLNPAAARYHAIKQGRTRAEVEAQLGKPIRQEEDGTCVWETRFDRVNYTLLKVQFDAEDRAKKVEITRAHGEISPTGTTSAVSVRST